MKKLLFLCWSLALLLFSCTNAADDALAPTEADGEYVTLTLDTGADAEEKESLRNTGVKLTLDADGKPRVHFQGFLDGKDNKLKSSIYTMVLKGENIIFSENLNWEVEEDGRRLTYRGPIKIKKELLQGEGELRIYAHTAAPGLNGYYRFWHPGVLPMELKAGSFVDTRIPHVMLAPLTQKGKVLHTADAAQSKFKAMGTLLSFKISNNLPVKMVKHDIRALYKPEHELYSYDYPTTEAFGLPVSIERGGGDVFNGGRLLKETHGQIFEPGQTEQFYCWITEDMLDVVKNFRYFGLGVEADFVKVAGEPGYGKLVEYELDFKPQKRSLDKGAFATDAYGNVLFGMSPRRIIPGTASMWQGYHPEYFYLYGYSKADAIANTTTEDAWLARYYLPSFTSYLNIASLEGVEEFPQDYRYFYSLLKNEGGTVSWSVTPPKEGLTEGNVFTDPFNMHRDILKFERGGPLVQSETKVALRDVSRAEYPTNPYGKALYMMRFLNYPSHRVFQRVRMATLEESTLRLQPNSRLRYPNMTRSYTHCEISFLPYDPAGLEGDAALTNEYWAAREDQVQKVYIRVPLSTRNLNPTNPEPHMMTIADTAMEMNRLWVPGATYSYDFGYTTVWWSGMLKSFGVTFRYSYTRHWPDMPELYGREDRGFFIPRYVR